MRFLPRLYKEIISKASQIGITIISARAMFEKQLPNGFKEWKIKAFMKIAE